MLTFAKRRLSLLSSTSLNCRAVPWLLAPIRIPILHTRIDPETGAVTVYAS